MRKLFLFILLSICFASQCFAWGGSEGPESASGTPWKTYAVRNTTGAYVLTAVSTSIISPRTSILGFQIMPLGTASENVCTIYDGGVSSIDEVIGEAECAPESYDGMWYPYPRTLEKQIYIHQGPNTVVTIYFE